MDSSRELFNDTYFRVIDIRMALKSLEITKKQTIEKRLEDSELHCEEPEYREVM